jgi:hypothetical protein
MDTCKTIKVKPWGEGQGEFVEINAEDFDPNIHEAISADEPAPEPRAPRKKGK